MNGVGRDDRGKNAVEKALKRLAPRPAPPGLRRRVLDPALEARRNAALTPGAWAAAAVCVVIASLALAADAVISRKEAGHIAALFGRQGAPEKAGGEAPALWAGLDPDLGDLDRYRIHEMALLRSGRPDDSGSPLREARERLKGMIEHEDPEDPR